uniref:Uncharacterized protein n=1 Tax=Salmonella sp. TaxID=599 RepID=A0A482ETF6_SALSP|nr:hypothetical protein NNIBIDOC_00158 [Salmonella sp.]
MPAFSDRLRVIVFGQREAVITEACYRLLLAQALPTIRFLPYRYVFLSSRSPPFHWHKPLGEDKSSLSYVLETWTLRVNRCFQAMNKSKLRVIRHEETVITNINLLANCICHQRCATTDTP